MPNGKYANHWPAGAIRSKEELMDLVIEARKEKKAIRIHTVNQSGYMSVFYIYSKTKLYKTGTPHPNPVLSGISCPSDVLYPVFHDHSRITKHRGVQRWFKTDEHPASYGIDDRYGTDHRMFTNKMHAENYSELLKNDPEYLEEVRQWHAKCNKLFRDIGWD